MTPNKKIIVLAGSREQFERYLDEKGLTDSEAVYGYEPYVLMGIEAKEVVTFGTFYERNDAIKLEELAKSRIK